MSEQQKVAADISTLALSLGSSAAMALGLAPNPSNGKVEKNLEVAKFNIDMLVVLKEKTKSNLTKDEDNLLQRMIVDLQMKYVQTK
jgi:hypothetical protein